MLLSDFFPLSQKTVTHLTILLPTILLSLGLALSVLNDVYIERRQRRIMLVICTLMLVLIAQNCMDLLFQTRYTNPLARTVCGIVGYSVRPVILVLFCRIVNPKRRFWPDWSLAGLNAAVYLTALFSPLAFWIDEGNHFHRGPLNKFGFVVSIVLLVWLLYLSIRKFRSEQRHKNTLLLLPVLMIIGSVCLDYQVGYAEQLVTFLTYAIVLSSVFYYIWLHLQFVREHERDLEASQRIQIMMTQIQPHFLYNTLSTIQSLCRADPEKAFTVTGKFGTYLRQNLDSLNQTDLIPIQKELEHTRIYTEIEEVRFPRIRIEYDIEDADFSVPALTVQPLVENAIRHGVRIRQNGLVTVATRKGAACHEIIISDNGKGFDTETPAQAGGSHIGIRSVRERVETMCGGTLIVDSRPDEGTTVTIRIPAKESDID